MMSRIHPILQRLAEPGQVHLPVREETDTVEQADTATFDAAVEVTEGDVEAMQDALRGADGSAGLWQSGLGRSVSVSGAGKALVALMQQSTLASALRAAHFLLLLLQTAGCPVHTHPFCGRYNAHTLGHTASESMGQYSQLIAFVHCKHTHET